MKIVTDYLRSLHDERYRLIEEAGRRLRKIRFEIIVVRGVSGLAFGAMLAYRLNKGLLVVRKKGASTHSPYILEGNMPENSKERCIIVDDIISSGNTIKAIFEATEYKLPLAGVYLYLSRYYHKRKVKGKIKEVKECYFAYSPSRKRRRFYKDNIHRLFDLYAAKSAEVVAGRKAGATTAAKRPKSAVTGYPLNLLQGMDRIIRKLC